MFIVGFGLFRELADKNKSPHRATTVSKVDISVSHQWEAKLKETQRAQQSYKFSMLLAFTSHLPFYFLIEKLHNNMTYVRVCVHHLLPDALQAVPTLLGH